MIGEKDKPRKFPGLTDLCDFNSLRTVITWQSKDIKDCTKEELIEALEYLTKELERERSYHKATRNIMQLAESQE